MEGMRKITKNLSIPAEIRNEHLPITGLKRYLQTALFGESHTGTGRRSLS
jgi:hypothetical protein